MRQSTICYLGLLAFCITFAACGGSGSGDGGMMQPAPCDPTLPPTTVPMGTWKAVPSTNDFCSGNIDVAVQNQTGANFSGNENTTNCGNSGETVDIAGTIDGCGGITNMTLRVENNKIFYTMATATLTGSGSGATMVGAYVVTGPPGSIYMGNTGTMTITKD